MVQSARGSTHIRTDIQALRTVAVMAVVIVHIWPSRLTGGYIGVDIFFVISGFLITSHLIREIDRSGTVRLGRFWARRVRRLLPAAFTVLPSSIAATLVLLPWGQWIQGMREIFASAFYVQNWLLASDSVDYFAAGNTPTMVQHYWSLSVEEQFYLVWPLLLLAALWVARRMKLPTRTLILVALLMVFAASLVASVLWTQASQASAYFSTATRAWEFAAGGLLAFLPSWGGASSGSRTRLAAHLLASWGGLALIAFAVVTFDGGTAFPGYMAMIPVIGTAAVIWAGENDSTWSPNWLGKCGPVQWIGEVSYSVYLWHWPIVILYPVLRGNSPELKGGLLIIAVTFALAWLSKKYIEDPFRSSARWSGTKRSFGFAFSGMGVLGAAAVLSLFVMNLQITAAASTLKPYQTVEELKEDVEAALAAEKWELPDALPDRSMQAREWVVDDCLGVSTPQKREQCVYGDPESQRVIAVVGDSFATHFLPALRAGFGDAYRIQPLTKGECPIGAFPVRQAGGNREFLECPKHNAVTFDYLRAHKPDIHIISDATASTLQRSVLKQSENEQVEAYLDATADAYGILAGLDIRHVFVIETAPRTNCFQKNLLSAPEDCEPDAATSKTIEVQKKKLALADRSGFRTIDVTSWLCDSRGVCPDVIGGSLVRADGGHLTDSFSRRIAPLLRLAIEDEAAG